MNRFGATLATGAVGIALIAATAYAQDDTGITNYGPETFTASGFNVDGFAGTVDLVVEDRTDVEISAHGPAEQMERFRVTTPNGKVEIAYAEEKFRWNDWSTWLGWWHSNNFELEDYPVVTVRLPAGMPVDVDGMTGSFTAGDLDSDLDFSGAGAVEVHIGRLHSADFSVAGAADVTLGDVSGFADVSISGAGDFDVASAEGASVSLHGAGHVRFGEIRGGLDISVAGMGEVQAASVDGPVDINLAGTGQVDIDDGRASSFDVSIAGAGDVNFGGTAVDPDISIAGAGDVYIERYEGRLSQSGMGDVTIGSGG